MTDSRHPDSAGNSVQIPGLPDQIRALPLRYFQYDFPGLICSVDSIEAQLETDAVDAVSAEICSAGGYWRNDVLVWEGLPVRVLVGRQLPSRTLVLLVQPIHGQPTTKTSELHTSINGFGAVSELVVEGPEQMRPVLESALSRLDALYRAAYLALEETFVTKYIEWRFTLFDRIYGLTNTHLRVQGNESLIGRYWFSLTDLKRTRFRYQFDRSVIERSVSWFKAHPSTSFSAYEAMSVLIVEEAYDAVFGADILETQPVVDDAGVVLLRFEHLPHIYQGQVPFGLAEWELYGDDAMACIDVVTTEGVSLQLNCPATGYREYQYALRNAADDIKRLFEENYKVHKKDLRRMSTALEQLRTKASESWVRDFSAEVLARFLREMTQ